MHLAPVTASSQIGWIQLLGQLHPQLRDAMFANPQQARRLDDLALAVKTGDRIGSVGRHDAFAARPTGTPDPSGGHQAVLHFEIFSPENLIQRFDPDAALHQQWTLTDTDRNALADNARRNLGRLTPFSTTAMRDRLDDLETDQAAADPRWFDPGEVFQTDAELHDLFSRVITRHVSEWAADWRTVLTRNRRAWGLTTEMINHGVSVADQFQWWNTIVPTGRGFRDHSALKVNRNTKPYYYHPIRLLNWLNGLQRVLDNPMGYAYSTNQAIDVDQDLRVSNPRYGWHWESRFLWTSRVL
jgi:hypothetical protein